MNDEYIQTCSQQGCSYPTTKICMDRLGADCPHLTTIVKPDSSDDETEDVPDEDASSEFHLPSNDELPEAMIADITNQFSCNLVLLVGEPECGKSTLYASLFDRFQKGGCGDYFFAGTKTPKGFERKCHKARVVSQNISSKTERTKTKEFVYLHLSVREKSLDKPVEHLLFADVNGEKFQSARNADDEMKSLRVFKRANHIFFVADGEVLLDKGRRHSAKSDVVNLIKRALQNEMVDGDKGVHVLITKWDIIQAKNSEAEVTQFFISPLQEKFEEIIKTVVKVASRSENENVPAGTGVDEFLKLSLSKSSIELDEFQFDVEDTGKRREFQRFKYNKR